MSAPGSARSPRLALVLPVLLPATLLAVGLPAARAGAQERRGPETPQEWLEECRNRDWGGEREHFCELRDFELPGSQRRLAVDGRQNGGVSVHAWDRNSILVYAKIRTEARTPREAEAIAKELRVTTEGGSISATGPSRDDDVAWSVSYELWVPRGTDYDLDLRTYNGGLGVADIGGRMRLETHNGGLSLQNLQGDVQARTWNGGVSASLAGARWTGAGLDVETHNGGVRLAIPQDYSARLETGTRNGGMNIDFPITVQGRIGRSINTTLGSGGPTVRVVTYNGGVTVKRRD